MPARSTLARSALAATLLVAAALATTPPASAAPPETMTFEPSYYEFTKACPFTLGYQEGPVRGKVRIFADGTVHATGDYWVTLTNLDSAQHKSLTVHAPGPQFFDGGPMVAPGPQLAVLFPTDANGPGVFLYSGRSVVTRAPGSSVITSIEFTGHRSGNLCDLLV